ncbi:Phage-related minor tail protein [Rubripirellula lacrimiformis]|uniref:Phage-related minor tail protein n=1 Tax=Rubripirellula lacrimiformis TaxID=1930273 RepID=A0A517NKY0_9BACT|nr:phage tail tape measure protein [Rubripirellula lacrimiformis]QDT07792.1 Phage-related minor tail protein [Rubripirellula lacrimiformis]
MAKSKIKAGEGYVEIGIRNRIAEGAKGVQSDLDKMGRRVTALGGIISGLGLTLGAPFAFAAGKLANFDDAMRSVGAISQASEKQLSMLTNTAKELGRTTSFTAVDVAMLMSELGRAGFDPSQINEMTGAVLNLSRATGTEAAQSAGILAATIRQYGLEAGDAARVSDGLTAAANKSFNSVESLGEALSYAGPEAKAFGLSLEETLAILGTLGNVGIQGSSAGTAIRRLLTLTGAEAEKMKRIFGVEFIDAAGNARPLIDTLGEVAQATNGLGTAARASKFNEAFGLLGITAAGALGQATTSTKALLTAIQEAEGIAGTTAERMDAGLGGSFRKIASAAEGAVIAIGESFGGSLQSVTDSLTASLGGFTAWIEANKSLVAAVAATTVGMVGTGAAMIALGVTSQLVAAGIGTVGTAFAAVSGILKGVAAVTTAVKAVTLATAGAFAVAQGTSAGMAAGIALVNAAYGISPAFAGIAVAAWGSVGAVLTALSAPSTLAAAMAGLVGSAWTAAAGVVGSAWAVITGPILPFVAAGAAAVAVIGSLVGVAGYAAVAGMDLARAWDIVKTTVGGLVSVVSDTFSVIRDAMSSGDFATAAQALWLGVRAAFWTGVEGAMDAFKWLWSEAWATGKRFFTSLVETAWKATKAIAMAIVNPIQAAREIGTLVGELAGAANNFDVSGRADAAKQELAVLRQSLALSKERNKVEEASGTGGAAGGAPGKQQGQSAHEKDAAVITDKIKAIELEIFALENGEDAANRKRLADEGLTDVQIKQIEVLKAKKKAIEDAQQAEKDAAKNRVDSVMKKGDQLAAAGVSPKDIFDRVMKQIGSDQQNGLIGKDTADTARGTARENLADQLDQLKADGKALADSLRTPAEVLNAKLREITQLQSNGAITDKTALRAEDRVRREFAEEQERSAKTASDVNTGLDQERSRTGPTSTFSAAAASIIGAGNGSENEAMKLRRETAANTATIARQSKKNNVARFA